MTRIIRTLSLLALLSTACGEPSDDDSLGGLTPDCTPDQGGLACAGDPTRPVTYSGPGLVGGEACTVTTTPAYGYFVCEAP